MARNNKYKQPDSFDPSFNMMDQAGASITNLFNSNSLFNPGFIDNDYNPSSIPLQNNKDVRGRRLKQAPYVLSLTLEYEGKDDKFVFKNQAV